MEASERRILEGAAIASGESQQKKAVVAHGKEKLHISLTRNPETLPEELLKEYEPVGQDLLGEGAFAVVRLLRQRVTGKLFALKCVEKYPLRIRDMINQMNREVRIQKALCHQNILQLVRVFDDTSYLFMLLEYCEKGPLHQIVADSAKGRLEEHQAAFYFRQIARGVEWMHRNHCVHRDLKLENMLLTQSNELKICDFGWSAEVEIEKMLKTVCGTTAYWPPEIWENARQDETVDMWALGCLLYEMLAGHPPFFGQDQTELKHKVLSVDTGLAFPSWFSDEVIHVIKCLLRRNPRERLKCKDLLNLQWLVNGGENIVVAPQVVTANQRASSCIIKRKALVYTQPHRELSPSVDQAIDQWLAVNPLSEGGLSPRCQHKMNPLPPPLNDAAEDADHAMKPAIQIPASDRPAASGDSYRWPGVQYMPPSGMPIYFSAADLSMPMRMVTAEDQAMAQPMPQELIARSLPGGVLMGYMPMLVPTMQDVFVVEEEYTHSL